MAVMTLGEYPYLSLHPYLVRFAGPSATPWPCGVADTAGIALCVGIQVRFYLYCTDGCGNYRSRLTRKFRQRTSRQLTRKIQITKRENRERKKDNMLQHTLRKLMDDALTAQTHRAHTPDGCHEPTAYIKTPAIRSTVACLKTENLPALFFKSGHLARTPGGAVAGDTVRMDAGLIAMSRTAAAGAHVLIYPEATKAHAVGRTGAIAVESLPGSFRTIEAATFGNVEDDADAPVVALPVLAAPIDWKSPAVLSKGVRFQVKRSERRALTSDELCSELVTAITLGLSRAADHVLLTAIAAETPAGFSLASAAAQGLMLCELRALVGTAGAGANIGEDGTLRAAGIPAELTPDTSATFIGAFNRAGVAIHEDVHIHFERVTADGELAVTAWAHMLPLLPDAGKFWAVA